MNNRLVGIVGLVLVGGALVLGVVAMIFGGPFSMMGPGGMMGYPGGSSSTSQSTPVVGATQVAMQDYAFQPANIQIRVGTTVTWTNKDAAPHTVTFRSGAVDSGILQQGQTFRYTFTHAGTYAYYCSIHLYMVGSVIVTT